MVKNKLTIIYIFFTLFLSCFLFNLSVEREREKNSSNFIPNIKISSPTDIILSTNPENPTEISTNVYYSVDQQDTLYLSLNLERNEVYYMHLSSSSDELFLYFDSSFSSEIKYTDDNEIIFAPSISKSYYLKWINYWPPDSYFCVWKANKYDFDEIKSGINIVYDDADWAHTVIFFTSPMVEETWGKYDIEIENPTSWDFCKINLSNNEAYNSNEKLWGSDLRTSMLNNPETGFLLIFGAQGFFQITLPQTSGGGDSLEIDWKVILVVSIFILSILGVIGAIYYNYKYWNIGHRIKKRRREKREIREAKIQQKIQQITGYSKKGKRIDDVVDSWKTKKSEKKGKNLTTDHSKASKKIDEIVESWSNVGKDKKKSLIDEIERLRDELEKK